MPETTQAILHMFHSSDEGARHVHYFAAIPEELIPFLPGFWWDQQKLFEVDAEVHQLETTQLLHFLRIPIWRGTRQSGLFTVTGREIIESPSEYSDHWSRIAAADLTYPIVLHRRNTGLILLDGFHRLTKAVHANKAKIRAKILTDNQVSSTLETNGFLGQLNRLARNDPKFLENARRIAIELLLQPNAVHYPPWNQAAKRD